jgi:hypothetical protein
MAGMTKSTYIGLVAVCTIWGLLALTELTFAYFIGEPAVIDMIRFGFTRWAILKPDLLYFSGMLVGELIKLAIAFFLIRHAVWIFRKRLMTGGELPASSRDLPSNPVG